MRTIKSKIFNREDLAKILKPFQTSGKKIGLTNGAFDLLHAGHVHYLEKAKNYCDILVVSINTDESIKEYKGYGRPIVSQEDRAEVVASIESVDFVSFHNERRMRTSLEILKPNFYIKAGDYKIAELTSRDVLKKWGGEVILIPFVEGRSTSSIVHKIITENSTQPVSINLETKEGSGLEKAVILDRDGVINEEVEYLHDPDKFFFIKDSLSGLKMIQNMGYKLVVITTQAGIGLGYFTKEDFFKVNKVMLSGLAKHKIIVSKVYYCPHTLSDNCLCRKPKTGLLDKAKEDLNLDLLKTWIIGDKTSDIEMGKKSGIRTILVKTGHAGEDKEYSVSPDYAVGNLVAAAEVIRKNE